MDMAQGGDSPRKLRLPASNGSGLARAPRIALALLVRYHLLAYKEVIRASYAARHGNGMTVEEAFSFDASTVMRVPYRAGVKATTALAQLIGLPPYPNAKKAKPEPAKHLIDFMQAAGPAHADAIFRYFRDQVLTPDYRLHAPLYIQMVIHEVFDRAPNASAASGASGASSAMAQPLAGALDQARHAPAAIISAVEETALPLIGRLQLFEGMWHVLRYSHTGKRIVRLLLHVVCCEGARPRFTLYYRTRNMTLSHSPAAYVTHGSLMLLKGGQHALFFGQEEEHPGQSCPDGYPLFITCPTRISRQAPFIGLVNRRHDEGTVFAIKAQFVPAPSCSVDDVLAHGNVGSFETPDEIAAMAADIAGFEGLMRALRRDADDQKGGLNL